MLERLGRISPLGQRLLLLVGCALFFFAWWAQVPVTQDDEARYTETVREMIASGDTLIPHYNFVERYQKPILYYWVQLPAVKLFGLNEAAARVPSAVLATGLVLLIHGFLLAWLPRRAADARARVTARGAAFLAGMMLITVPFMVVWARGATTDMTITCFTALALLAALQADLVGNVEGRERHARWWYIGVAVAAGLAFLTKGPVGVVVPALAWLAYHLRQRDLRGEVKRVPWLPAVAAFALVAAPWYLATVVVKGTGFVKHFFLAENFGRASSTMEGHGIDLHIPLGHPGLTKIASSLASRLVGLLPYYPIAVLLLFPYGAFLVREMLAPFTGNEEMRQDPVVTRIRRFACAWVFTDIILLSLARTQLPSYIHAIVPGAALLLAVHLYARLAPGEDTLARRDAEAARWPRLLEIGILVGGGLLFTLGLIAALSQGKSSGFYGWLPFPHPAAEIVMGLLTLCGIAFVVGSLIHHRARRPAALIGWTAAAWVPFMGVILFVGAMAVESSIGPIREIGLAIRQQPGNERVLVFRQRTAESLVYYARRDRAVEYYNIETGDRQTAFAPYAPSLRGDLPSFSVQLQRTLAEEGSALVVTTTKGMEQVALLGDIDPLTTSGNAVLLRVHPRTFVPQSEASEEAVPEG